ncbi:hypothetical protein NMYAN_140019 [Nitrosomonas nitrosa]|uniref:Uncharacterized protein n=1 Tax=Nitrosomonas nitrosa TaxID=52442 RepID=A0A8H9D897_9PROT|nr:hypothetical protein NMYAN_140019 [Nitrosomonas nitrosa]
MANLQTGKIDQLLDDLKTSANEQIKKSRLMAIFLDRWLRLIWLWVPNMGSISRNRIQVGRLIVMNNMNASLLV